MFILCEVSVELFKMVLASIRHTSWSMCSTTSIEKLMPLIVNTVSIYCSWTSILYSNHTKVDFSHDTDL